MVDHTPAGAASEDLPDPVLVARYLAGVPSAFAALVARHGPALYRFLVGWLRQPELAEEIAQAAFVKAAVRIDQLADGQAFLSWLMTIARTTALDHMRAERPERRVALDEVPEPSVARGKGDLAIDVWHVLDQLEPDQREVLLLADYLQLSMTEVAATLEIGLSAAKMRAKRARARFRELYRTDA